MAEPTPFYQRTLDSFADDIITRCKSSEHGGKVYWYAVLDVGPKPYVSDPDFSSCKMTREEAIEACAKKIREDAVGIGKYAPHSVLVCGYDLHWRLMKHWAEKEVTKQMTEQARKEQEQS